MTDPPEPNEPPEAPPLNTPHCQECDAPLDPDQRYCLQCGAPTAKAPRLATGKGARIIALALVLLAIGTGALAVAVSRESSSAATKSGSTPAGTTSPTGTTSTSTGTSSTGTGSGFETVTSGTTTSTPTTSTPTSTPTTSTPTTSTPTTSTPTTSTTASWPAGTQAWTVILASATSQATAESIAAKATGDGLSAGVLYSSAYSTLTPGYWVVFSGTYSTSSAAQAAATSAHGSFPGANARFIPAAS